MKRFPYTVPELGFIVFVMALPLLVAFAWKSETIWGFLGKVGVGMVVGFAIWFTLVIAVCRRDDRKKREEKTQA